MLNVARFLGFLASQPRLEFSVLFVSPGGDALTKLMCSEVVEGVVLVHFSQEELTSDSCVCGGAVPTVLVEIESVALNRGHESALIAALDVFVELLVEDIRTDDRGVRDRREPVTNKVRIEHFYVEGRVECHDRQAAGRDVLMDLRQRLAFVLTVRPTVLVGDAMDVRTRLRDRDIEFEQPLSLGDRLSIAEVDQSGGDDSVRGRVSAGGLGVEGKEAWVEPPWGARR